MKKVYLLFFCLLLIPLISFSNRNYHPNDLIVQQPINDVMVFWDRGNIYIDLSDVFYDDVNPEDPITYLPISTDSTHIIPYIENENTLRIEIVGQNEEPSTITITADNGGPKVDHSFDVATIDPSNEWLIDFYVYIENACAPVESVPVSNESYSVEYEANTYKWYLNNELISTEFTPVFSTMEPGIYDLRFEVYNSFDELLASKSQYFYVDGFNGYKTEPETACPGEEVTFYLESQVDYIRWEFSDGTIYEGNYIKHAFNTAGTFSVKAVVQEHCEGTQTHTQNIVIGSNVVPQPQIIASSMYVCPNEVIHFNTEKNYEIYNWSFGEGGVSGKANPSYAYATPGEYEVTVTVTNKCGKENTDTIDITVIENLESHADFSFSPEFPCPETKIHFNAHENLGSSYEWNFGDGGKAYTRFPKYAYAQPGQYQVQLVVKNACGSTDTTQQDIWVELSQSSPPVDLLVKDEWEYKFYSNDTLTICPGTTVSFYDGFISGGELIGPQRTDFEDPYSFTPIKKYMWEFKDEILSTDKEITKTFLIPGSNYLTVYKTSNCSDWIEKDSILINVTDTITPVVDLEITPDSICPGEKIYFYDNANYDPQKSGMTYDINFGDGQSQSNINSLTTEEPQVLASHQYINTGSYSYTFSATNRCNQTVSSTGKIVVDNNVANPFYYVSNSTADPSEGEKQNMDNIQNWAIEPDPVVDYHTFNISLQAPWWSTSEGGEFYVFFWYGELNLENDPGLPDGMVPVKDKGTDMSFTAYVPINGETSVGIMGAWYCDNQYFGKQPTLMGQPTADSQPINSFQLIDGGSTNVGQFLNDFYIDNSEYNGICRDPELELEGHWVYKKDDGTYYQLEIDEQGYFDFYHSPDKDVNYNKSPLISGDWFEVEGYLEFYFYSSFEHCQNGFFDYDYTLTHNSLELSYRTDTCSLRNKYFEKTFTRKYKNYTPACPGDPISFTAIGGTNYTWKFGDDQTSTKQFPTHTYTAPGEYQVKAIIETACGVKDTVITKAHIDEKNMPDANFNIDQGYNQLTAKKPYQFHPDLLDNIYNEKILETYEFTWDFGNGVTSNNQRPFYTFESPGEYYITLTVSNGCGTTTKTKRFYVYPQEKECIAKFDVEQASNNKILFTNTSVGNITNMVWTYGDGSRSTSDNSMHQYNAGGIYEVCLAIYDSTSNCFDSYCKKVIVGDVQCKADFSVVTNPISKKAFFTNLSTGSSLTYSWDFGGNLTSNLANPEIQYKTNGVYEVCLTVYNETTGCMSTMCKTVEVGIEELIADFSHVMIPETNSIRFFDDSQGNIMDWYWSFGDGSYSKEQEPVHLYTKAGKYNVCLVTTGLNGKSSKKCKEIIVGEELCDIHADFELFLKSNENKVVAVDRSTGGVDSWYWTFGDEFTSKNQNPYYQFTETGKYLITLAVKNSENGCTDIAAKTVQIGTQECNAGFEYKVDPETNTVEFTNTSESDGNDAKYLWYFDDGFVSSDESPSHEYNESGIYRVGLTMSSGDGACWDYTFQEIQVGNVDCSAYFTTFVDSTTQKVSFQAETIGSNLKYFWYFGDGTISEKVKPEHVYPQPGYYYASLATHDPATGCMDFYEDVVLVSSTGNDLEARFRYQVDNATNTVKFFDESSGGNDLAYLWNFGDEQFEKELSNPSHTYDMNGFYNVCLTVYKPNGMQNTTCKTVQVAPDISNSCKADFIYAVDSLTKTVNLKSRSLFADSWQWDFGDDAKDTGESTSHQYDNAGFYKVKLVINNSTSGCTDKAVKMINISEESTGYTVGFDYEQDTTDNKGKKGYPVDFVGAAFGDPAKVVWDFGDGNQDSTSMTTTNYYEEPGDYEACLTVSDPNTGESDTDCQDINIEEETSVQRFDAYTMNLSIYPNPANDFSQVDFTLPLASKVEISAYNMIGNKIETILSQQKSSGRYYIKWDTTDLPDGIYYIKLQSDYGSITQKIVVTH